MSGQSLETLRLRRQGLLLLVSRGNADAIAELERVNARIDVLTQIGEPLFAARKTSK